MAAVEVLYEGPLHPEGSYSEPICAYVDNPRNPWVRVSYSPDRSYLRFEESIGLDYLGERTWKQLILDPRTRGAVHLALRIGLKQTSAGA